jgi:uncharacterized damage-inducible protein DinB
MLSQKLENKLQQVLSGHPWYGSPVYAILDGVTFEQAFERPPNHAHSIAEIVLHMISWTEEVMDRMNGMAASVPSSGDWPDTGIPTEEKWKLWVDDLKLVNVNLVRVISDFPDEQWSEPIKDERDPESGTGVSFEELVDGLIQHHVYHSAQISILKRIV